MKFDGMMNFSVELKLLSVGSLEAMMILSGVHFLCKRFYFGGVSNRITL